MLHMSMVNKSRGFTLIEVLIIAPLIILMIGAFIAFVVNLTGESLVLREKNSNIYDIQNTLDDIEQTVNRSAAFVASTPTMPFPQGSGNNTAIFQAKPAGGVADALILLSPSTTKNPYDPTRALISLGAAPCNPALTLHYYYTIYFVQNDALNKRTVVPTTAACAAPWQRNSCAATTMAGNSRCVAEDEVLVRGVADTTAGFTVDYFQANGTTTSAPGLAKKATVSLQASRQVAGETVSGSGSMQTTRVSSQPFNDSTSVNPN